VETLRELNTGDEVFVVHQRRRGQTEQRTGIERVENVGRKFTYIKSGKFHSDTGVSAHHPDSNERCNGLGFDVYLNESEWRREQHEEMRFKELSVILCGNYHYALKKLSPTVVEAIHDILEKEAT